MTRTVWVHAWEYVNGTEAGGGGFDWYPNREDALTAYNSANREPYWAHFFFPYETELAESFDQTTEAIDGELHEACAHAVERWISPEVHAYWNKNNMQMELS